jgi:hypothetical protein
VNEKHTTANLASTGSQIIIIVYGIWIIYSGMNQELSSVWTTLVNKWYTALSNFHALAEECKNLKSRYFNYSKS